MKYFYKIIITLICLFPLGYLSATPPLFHPFYEMYSFSPHFNLEGNNTIRLPIHCTGHFVNGNAAMTLLGDSRLYYFTGYSGFGGNILNPQEQPAPLIFRGQLRADDESSAFVLDTTANHPINKNGIVYQQSYPGKTAKEMVGLLKYCNELNYLTTWRSVGPTFIHAGGNDIIGGMRQLFQLEGQAKMYMWLVALVTNPFGFISDLISGRTNNYVELWWIWQSELLVEDSVLSTNTLTYQVVRDNGKPVVVSIPAIAWATDNLMEHPDQITDGKRMLRLAFIFTAFAGRLAARLGQEFGIYMLGDNPLISIEDSFPMSFDPSNYNLGAFDAVHFSAIGQKRWGSHIAKVMALKNILSMNESIRGTLEIGKRIDAKAIINGVDQFEAFSIEPTMIGTTGAYKEFIRYVVWPFFPYLVRVYAKNNSEAYWVPDKFLTLYQSVGETNSSLGYPTSDPYWHGPFMLDMRQNFENGCMNIGLAGSPLSFPQIYSQEVCDANP
ncbi:hypothetical protein AB3N59_20195 (plasmid) [Leptospira sp. WS92.C1]